jgi:hypothetical protein
MRWHLPPKVGNVGGKKGGLLDASQKRGDGVIFNMRVSSKFVD